MPCCVGCSRVDLGHELCALCERWYTIIQTVHTAATAATTTRHSQHAVFCIVCSPDDEHNDALNMLS